MTRPSPIADRLSGRFAPVIAALQRAVAARMARERVLAPLLMLVWSRLQRMARRLAAESARTARRPGAVPPAAPSAGQRPVRSRARLPEGFAWLVRLVPEAACFREQLQRGLSDPDVAAALADAPGAGRVMRPLCRMLGVDPGPAARPRPVAPEPAPDPPARPRAARARRERVPRGAGRPWLRWRPAGAAS